MSYSHEVESYLAAIDEPQKQADTRILVDIIHRVTGQSPAMWGTIIGFGSVHYKYSSGHEGDTMIIGLAARKQALTLHGLIYYAKNQEHLRELGTHKAGKGCLYIKRLSDVNMDVLEELIAQAWKNPVMSESAPAS